MFVMIGSYVFFTSYYMGPGFTQCNDSIYGFGDSTGGPIWRNSLKPEQPLFGGPQTSTNYPYGESLYSPVGYVASIQTVAMNVSSKVVGAMCAYNLYNIVGYILTGVVMCLFIAYLTRNKWVALIAGYAVAFTPYVQSKVGGHPNYGYAALLIGILWLYIHLLQTRKKWAAVLFGVLLALSAYLDPYFILLSATIVGSVTVAWMLLGIWHHRHRLSLHHLAVLVKPYVVPILLAMVAFVVCIAPIATVRIRDAGAIETTVGKMRGDIVAAATLCSNTPIDYLLPDPTNIHLVGIFGSGYTAKNVGMRHWCGFGESRVSVSLTLGLVLLIGVITSLYLRWKKRNVAFRVHRYSTVFVITTLTVLALVAFWAGMPPKYGGLYTLSGVILEVTTMWRIFAREFLVVNIAVVAGASIALAYLLTVIKTRKFPKWLSWLLLVLVFCGVLLEYQINSPFSPMTFSYERDVPKAYRVVKDTSSIDAIAEYPLDRIGLEHDSVVYYMTMQAVHGKKLFNSVLSTDSKENEHISLKDLGDPQTLPALRYLGIDAIVVHGEPVEAIASRLGSNISVVQSEKPVVYSLKMIREDTDPTVALVTLNSGATLSNILAITKGYAVNLPNIQSPLATEYELLNKAELTIASLLGAKVTDAPMCFDIKMAAVGDSGGLTIKRGADVLVMQQITDQYSSIRWTGSTGDVFTITNDKGFNMRIDNLSAGCGVSL